MRQVIRLRAINECITKQLNIRNDLNIVIQLRYICNEIVCCYVHCKNEIEICFIHNPSELQM